jgi:hypothetical protein
VREVGRKPVTQINQRRREPTLAEQRAPLDARRGARLTPDESALRARQVVRRRRMRK